MATVRSSFRQLLRHLKTLPSFAAVQESGFKAFIFKQIRERRNETDVEKVHHYRHTMSEYLRTIEAVNEQKYLRGLDHGDILTDHEKNEIIAKKVGFVMPEEYSQA